MHGLSLARTEDNRHISIILDHVDDPRLRTRAISALRYAEQDLDRVIPVLVKALNDENTTNRLLAVYSLGVFGPDAKNAIPALLELVDEVGQSDPSFSETILLEIWRIDPSALAQQSKEPQ